LKDKKLILTTFLLPVTVLFSGAALATNWRPVAAAVGAAPSVQAAEAETYVGIPIEISLAAIDADSDIVLYQLTEQPRLGTASINGNTLTYTPGQKAGKDKFAYTAADANGNIAAPAPITVKIGKNRSKTTYADMEGNPAHYAALQLAKENIMTGEKIGNCSFFHPTQPVTRNEFIAMATVTAELPVEPTTQTDFADDSGLSAWAKPFVSTAAANGLVNGYAIPSGLSEIRGQNFITVAEASAIVNNLLLSHGEEAQYTAALEGETDMDWAQTAVRQLERLEVLSPYVAAQAEETLLTRQAACELLYKAMLLL